MIKNFWNTENVYVVFTIESFTVLQQWKIYKRKTKDINDKFFQIFLSSVEAVYKFSVI